MNINLNIFCLYFKLSSPPKPVGYLLETSRITCHDAISFKQLQKHNRAVNFHVHYNDITLIWRTEQSSIARCKS